MLDFVLVLILSALYFTASEGIDANATALPLLQQAKGIARSYYAAGVFFDVLNIFEQSNVEEALLEKDGNDSKRKYCKWRAAEILKAVKTNSDLPAPVKEDTSQEEDEGKGESEADMEITPSLPPASQGGDNGGYDDFGIPEAPRGQTASMQVRKKICQKC